MFSSQACALSTREIMAGRNRNLFEHGFFGHKTFTCEFGTDDRLRGQWLAEYLPLRRPPEKRSKVNKSAIHEKCRAYFMHSSTIMRWAEMLPQVIPHLRQI
jgi:hypothetical protein